YPWDGDAVMEGVRASKGGGVAVSDEEILEAVRALASYEGVFAEPSGAAGVAGLRRLLEEGYIDRSEVVVVLVTGSGLKEVDKLAGQYPEPPLINPDISELSKHIKF
ncbi:MAG: pyridoxal-phosphate dependent enzyme, partial [Nitrososphaerota archaeon]